MWHRHDGVLSRPIDPDRVSHTVSQAEQHMASVEQSTRHCNTIERHDRRTAMLLENVVAEMLTKPSDA